MSRPSSIHEINNVLKRFQATFLFPNLSRIPPVERQTQSRVSPDPSGVVVRERILYVPGWSPGDRFAPDHVGERADLKMQAFWSALNIHAMDSSTSA